MTTVMRYPSPLSVTPFSDVVDRFFQQAFTWPRLFSEGFASIGLGGNLYETPDTYIMQVMLPGVKVDELQITARENVLFLQGRTEFTVPDAQLIWGGMSSREFREEVILPGEVDAEKATAAYYDGILTLTLPKAKYAHTTTIKVIPEPTYKIEKK